MPRSTSNESILAMMMASHDDEFLPLDAEQVVLPNEFWQEVHDIIENGPNSPKPIKFRPLRPNLPIAPIPLLQPVDLLAKREGPLRFKLARYSKLTTISTQSIVSN